MLSKIRKMMTREEGQQGFTLIELIIVMAILAILAAIALPRYRAIQGVSRIRADAATAQSICAAARLQETNETPVTDYASLQPDYFNNKTKPQSGGDFALTRNASDFEVKWIPDDTLAPGHGGEGHEQTVTEGKTFIIK